MSYDYALCFDEPHETAEYIDKLTAERDALKAEVTKYKTALHEINTCRGSTLNFGIARAIACKVLGVESTDSKEPPVKQTIDYMEETSKEASARAIADHNEITALKANLENLEMQLADFKINEKGYEEIISKKTYNEVADIISEVESLRCNSEPVAWLYKGDSNFDGKIWHDNYLLTTSKKVAIFYDNKAKPLFTYQPMHKEVKNESNS